MILFILFPLAYTVGLAFTNYSAKNQLSFERAQSVLLDRTYQSGDSYPFSLIKTENGHRISVKKVISCSQQKNSTSLRYLVICR